MNRMTPRLILLFAIAFSLNQLPGQAQAPAGMQLVSSPKLGFAAYIPGNSTMTTERSDLGAETKWTSTVGQGAYLLGCHQYPGWFVKTLQDNPERVQHALDAGCDKATKSARGEEYYRGKISIKGWPGRHVEVTGEKAYSRARYFYVNGTIYSLIATGTHEFCDSAMTDRFLASLSISAAANTDKRIIVADSPPPKKRKMLDKTPIVGVDALAKYLQNMEKTKDQVYYPPK